MQRLLRRMLRLPGRNATEPRRMPSLPRRKSRLAKGMTGLLLDLELEVLVELTAI